MSEIDVNDVDSEGCCMFGCAFILLPVLGFIGYILVKLAIKFIEW